MKFQKGHNFAKGGARPGAGRPSKHTREAKKIVEKIVAQYIWKRIRPVLKAYLQLAGGRTVKYRDADGHVIYREKEVDAATVRHFIDKLLPNARTELSLEVHGKVEVFTNVNPDDD